MEKHRTLRASIAAGIAWLLVSTLYGEQLPDSASPQTLIPLRKGDLWGFIDRSGVFAIKPQFDEAGYFYEGIARVRVGGKQTSLWGYIDSSGKFVINPAEFAEVGNFHGGMARVRELGNGRMGYIDQSGTRIWGGVSVFDDAGDFSEGLARVKGPESYWAYIGKTGKSGGFLIPKSQYIEREFVRADDFSEGLAAVVKSRNSLMGTVWTRGYIDKSGKLVITLDKKIVEMGKFSEGLARVKIGNWWGYIDQSGQLVIDSNKPLDPKTAPPPGPDFLAQLASQGPFSEAGDFSEGLAWVTMGGKQGFIDKTGKVVIKPQFDAARDFHEGLARVAIGNKQGYIDTSGKIVINPQFDEAEDFFEGIARIMLEGKMGYIDRSGQYIVNPLYNQ